MRMPKIDAYLKVLNGDMEGIKFWRHKGMHELGLAEQYGPLICHNGVHLTRRGQYKLYK